MKVDKLVAIVVLVWCTERQGWDPRGLASTSSTKFCGLGLGLDDVWPWLWLRGDLAVRR